MIADDVFSAFVEHSVDGETMLHVKHVEIVAMEVHGVREVLEATDAPVAYGTNNQLYRGIVGSVRIRVF